ncbi:hypothetical protein LSH36_210g04007 [Paralvinella palmiformis]|uniref:Centriolar and ciliogenesis-associated protein HYLS1 C-terminal domain-containing protein n=1 Tax=Paralvinella palmiformis TaxID=53620 RepID=A0AAD9JNM0_9ANNE|nr:hypothetical protein LSH36_210g04007 [Paralvinella palmiformis]
MDEFDFTEDEIREQLEILGYTNVPMERLQEFKRDLEHLVKRERSKNSSLFSTSEQSSSSDSEIQRARHLNLNNHIRQPFDDLNHRMTAGGSNSLPEHTKYGRDSIHKPQPVDDVNKQHRVSDSTQAGDHLVRQYTLYTGDDREDQTDSREEDTTLNSTTSTERRIMKRKILRKHDGHTEIYETESESGDVDSLQERLRSLPISVHITRPATAPEHRTRICEAYSSKPCSARPDYATVYRLPEDYEGPKALIRPMEKDPHTKNIKKADPVAKYQQYRSSWQQYRPPGEKQHKSIRWGIREQMLYHDQVVDKKQHKVHVPNTYTIPSDKKRKNLRWQVRYDLAQGIVPSSMFD